MFLYLGVVLALLGLSDGCGQRPSGMRVINGQNAAPHSWPWQISLRVRGRHICGGSLITPDWVLTAAHCVARDPSASRYTVVVGGHRITSSTSVEQTLELKQVIVHERYGSLTHDIALLQLARPVTLNSKVTTVCLPDGDARVGALCYITGWGRTDNGPANTLQQAMLPIASHEECRKKYKVRRAYHLCAGEARSGASGGCNGDSGGPLVCEEDGHWVLHGAVSFGKKYCPTTHYTVFTRVNSYLEWISSKIAGAGGGGGGGEGPSTRPPPNTRSPPPETQPPPPTCRDKSDDCVRYERWCKSSANIRDFCRKTCELC